MTEGHGRFIWYDLMTTDVAAAAKFYGDVVGWTAMDSGMTHQKYVLFSQGPQMVAGLMNIPPESAALGVPPCWTGHIAVDDVDEYAAKVEAAGGKIRRAPEDIPTIGRFAVVEDPAGAVFILFKGTGTAPPLPGPDEPGYIGWHELHAGDLEAAWKFYEPLFGWSKVSDFDMGPMGSYRLFATNAPEGATLGDADAVGGMMTKMPQVPGPFWLYYFNVPSTATAMERVKAGGGQLITGPHQVPGGQWMAQFTDPQGAIFAVVSREP